MGCPMNFLRFLHVTSAAQGLRLLLTVGYIFFSIHHVRADWKAQSTTSNWGLDDHTESFGFRRSCLILLGSLSAGLLRHRCVSMESHFHGMIKYLDYIISPTGEWSLSDLQSCQLLFCSQKSYVWATVAQADFKKTHGQLLTYPNVKKIPY